MAKVRIKSVLFHSSISIGSYQHVHVEASADVLLNQTPEEVLEGVKAFVAKELVKAKYGRKPQAPVVQPSGGRFSDLLTAEENRRGFGG